MQKSLDAASNLKKSAAPTVPVRSRGMPRKMTDTSIYHLFNLLYTIFFLIIVNT